jgi:hypothetical protein
MPEVETTATDSNKLYVMSSEEFNYLLDQEIAHLEKHLNLNTICKEHPNALVIYVLLREIRNNPIIHMAIDQWQMSGNWLWQACEELELITVLCAIEKSARASHVAAEDKGKYCYGILKKLMAGCTQRTIRGKYK